ncbi:MAG: hypothetical protein ACXADH_16000 [Candidatus Kariarchaeaceae archaeon]|jgi:hypothetical protein
MTSAASFFLLLFKFFGILLLTPVVIVGVLLFILSLLNVFGVNLGNVMGLVPINETLLDYLLIFGRTIGVLIVAISWSFLTKIIQRKSRDKFLVTM